MKKYTYIFTCLLFVSASVSAQTKTLKRANKLFEIRAYEEAATIYAQHKGSDEALRNLADSYYYNSKMEKATKAYKEYFNNNETSDSINSGLFFRYAQALKGINNYEEADKWLSKYYKSSTTTSDFIKHNDKTTPHVFNMSKLQDQKATSDFGMSFYGDDQVVFASSRNSSNPLYAWNKLPYLDLYKATMTERGTLENIAPFSENINTNSHESNATFSKDGKTMYFNRTLSRRKQIGNDKIAHIKIYKAEFVNDKWTNVSPLPFCSDEFSTMHPTLSKNGKTLYFSSDREGGYGSFDIYKVAVNADGSYGEPENLGNKINTEQREVFPFISEYNVLYFSSIGHMGYGGLDVFRSNTVSGSFDRPVNLGKSINSNLDDFAYVIREKNDKGYLSSNRTGSDKTYGFVREENILTKYMVEGIVSDKHSKELLVGSLVTLMDESGSVLQDTIVGKDAKYLFKIDPNTKYVVRGTRKAYIPVDVEFSTDSKGKIQHDIELVIESYADAEERVRENERGEVEINLDRIYFDFDKSNIRPDAEKVLDVLVDLMIKYKDMEVEVSSHTDARGDDQYNLDLSKRRAASTLEYLVSKGIERNRLKDIGYGEMQPLNKCVREGICNDREYDINRRCEFKILN